MKSAGISYFWRFSHHEYRCAWPCRESVQQAHTEEFGAGCCSVSAIQGWKHQSNLFQILFIKESYLVRSSNVGVGIWEIRLLSSQRFWRWSPNSSKSPSANLIQHFKGINDTKKSLTRRHCCHSDGGFWAGGVVEGRLLGTGWFYLIAETATAVAL